MFDDVVGEAVHEQRDKILLEGEAPAGDSDGDDEEVFALNGLDDEGSDVEDEGDYDVDAEEADEAPLSTKKKKTSKSSKKPPPSDSEHTSESEEESWGKKKSAYYSSNAAQLASDDEEAHDMEEQEARRLQAKLREDMRDDDYAFADALNKVIITDNNDEFWNPPEKPAAIDPKADKVTIIRNLQKTSPETLALAQEWDDIARAVVKAEQKVEQAQSAAPQTLGLVYLHHQTVLTYATVLAYYLYLRASPKYAARPELLRLHPVFQRLLVLKQTLANLEDLDIGFSDSEDEDEDELDDFEDDEDLLAMVKDWSAAPIDHLEDGELDDLIKGLSQSTAERAKRTEEPPKKKKKVGKEKKKSQKIVYDVEEPALLKASTNSSEQMDTMNSSDPFGEATSIGSADAADKSARKKALRFHAARIESTSNRRQSARNALGGDEDIPYKARRKEAEKNKKRVNLGEGGEDLDDADPQPLPEKRKRSMDEENDEESDDDGYYSLVKKHKSEQKKQKKAAYEAEQDANRMEFDDDTPEGQRGISRAMMANKGLTPRRSKVNRNPRVKKRIRFEKAKKKLSSQKAVYKGGIGDVSRYGGETSGISKVVKSVSF